MYRWAYINSENKPESKFGIEKSEQEQNPMPHPK